MKKLYSLIRELIEVIFLAFVPILVVYQFLARPFLIQGASMEPNFQNRDYLIVDIISYKFNSPERKDVVVFRYPGNRSLYYIKRIVGVPGDRITLLDGNILINGEILKEEYLPAHVETNASTNNDFQLGEKQYFVLGDNRSASLDSRNWGPLERSDIIGAVRLRIWPLFEFYSTYYIND